MTGSRHFQDIRSDAGDVVITVGADRDALVAMLERQQAEIARILAADRKLRDGMSAGVHVPQSMEARSCQAITEAL